VVTTATANELVATVPAAATTGPLSVTVGGNTAASATDFVVDESLQPPAIHAVSPLIGAVGTDITVTGESLNPLPNQTSVRLNLRSVIPSSVADTQIVFPIPANASSGKVTVNTPFGVATSADDVLVTPSGIDPALVAQIRRLVID